MPFVERAEEQQVDLSQVAPITLVASEHDDIDPSFSETAGAAFRQENIIGSGLAYKRTRGERDDSFNVWEDIKGTEYEPEFERFADVFNANDSASLKAQIDMERQDKRVLEASGWTGLALSAAASILDPTILIPGGAAVRGTRIGYSTGKSAASVGTGAAAGTAVQEGFLQSTQDTRTGEETAIAIGGSAIIGGALGALASKVFTKAEWGDVTRRLEQELAEDIVNPADAAELIVRKAQSGGAAAVDDLVASLDDLGVGGPKAAKALANVTSGLKINPGVQTMLSPSQATRNIYNNLVDNPIYTKMNMEGKTVGPSTENLVKQYQRGALASWLRDREKLFKEARKAGQNLTRLEFNERVGRALRRNDLDPNSDFVSKAAQSAREKINGPLLNEAQGVKLLGEDVKVTTADTYFHRMYNHARMEAEEGRFKKIATDWLRTEFDRAMAEGFDSKAPDFVSKDDMDDYIGEIADNIFDNITGRGSDDVPEWLIPTRRGPLKERTFRIPDDLIEDFLEDDAEAVMRRYVRTMAAEVELTRKFGRADMQEQIAEIRADYKELRAELAAKELPKKDHAKQVEKLRKSENRDVENIEAFRDLIRGTYRSAEENSVAGKLTRGLLAWNYMRLLGGVTLTSMADLMRMPAVHGIRATMTEGLPNLVKVIRNTSLAANEAKELGAVTEMVLQTRLASLAEINDPYARGSAYERMLSNATNTFSKFTGLSYWNDATKAINAIMTQNRIIRNSAVGSYDKLNKSERSYMAFLGIDEDMARRINSEIKSHGTKDGSALVANTHKWEDQVARRTYAAALNKDVDRTIVTKGVADQPLWTRTNPGKLVAQFKSFMLASHQRVLIAGLQERPHRFAEMVVGGTVLGMMIAYLKFIERGDTERANALLENPGQWITDGLDRTGILGLPFEISNLADKASASYGGPPIGITAAASALADDPSSSGGTSRYASRNVSGAFLGPTIGILEDVANFSAGVIEGDLNKSQANAAIRQIPFGSLPGVKTGLQTVVKPALQDAVN